MKRKVPFAFVIPSLFFYTIIKIYPLIKAFFFSLTNWDGLTDYDFIGFQNYFKLFGDDDFFNSLKVTFTFLILVVVSVNVLGTIIAVMINSVAKRLGNISQVLIFLPVIISQVAVAFAWSNIYAYEGALDYVMNLLQLANSNIGWLTDPQIALLSISTVEIWRITGFHTVILLAALQTIPKELYEAGDIDGCSPFQRFRFITLPLMIQGLSVSIILSTIGGLKQFAAVKILTDGGPLSATKTIGYNIIEKAYDFNQQGYASAMAMVLFVIIVVITILQNNILTKKEVDL